MANNNHNPSTNKQGKDTEFIDNNQTDIFSMLPPQTTVHIPVGTNLDNATPAKPPATTAPPAVAMPAAATNTPVIDVKNYSYLSNILETQKRLKERKSQTITFADPIIYHLDSSIIFPNTINVIQGKSGVFKSGLAQMFCSVILKTNECQNVLCGYHANTNFDYAVCYVDTERNLTEQLPYALQKIQVKAGFEKEDHPENFDYITLLEVLREERFKALNEYLEHVRTKYKKHIFIVLDVVTDCIENFNNPADSMQLIDLMNVAINKYNVTFLCLIHENPGSEKARGHLGTEIFNKASTAIQVGYEKDSNGNDTELIKLKYIKTRATKRPQPIHLKYCDTENGLVLADSSEIEQLTADRKSKAVEQDMIDKLEFYLANGMLQKNDLYAKLRADFNCGESVIDRRLNAIIESEKCIYKEGVECKLIKEGFKKQGVNFVLVPKNNDSEQQKLPF